MSTLQPMGGGEATQARRGTGTVMAGIGGLFMPPDVVDAAEARARCGVEGLHASERAIRLAVLWTAVEELRKGAEMARRDVADTPPWRRRYLRLRGWFAADEQEWPYAFVPLCESLGLDAGAIRARMLAEAPVVEVVTPVLTVVTRPTPAPRVRRVPDPCEQYRKVRLR